MVMRPSALGPFTFMDYIASNHLGFEELLFYSDNLEVNFYLLKTYFLIYSPDSKFTIESPTNPKFASGSYNRDQEP